MIQIAAFLDREGGWLRHATGFARALNRREATELVDWREGGTASAARRAWRRLAAPRSVGISMGSIENTPQMATRYRIAYFIWETTRIPERKLAFLRRADMVWTMSDWGREILRAHGVPAGKIRIVPAGVDEIEFRPSTARRAEDGIFRFLSVGKWERRKANAELVRAFAEEFAPSERVELLLHCGAGRSSSDSVEQSVADVLRATGRTRARVRVSEQVLPAESYVRLMQGCHAFVLPTRAEGWGLPILEAMACGLACVVTGYSGVTAYANDENAYLVRVRSLVPVEDEEYFAPGDDWGRWAEPDWNHLKSLMRFVYENREAAMAKAGRAREDAARYWTWELAAEKALAHIRELRSGSRLARANPRAFPAQAD